MFLFAICTLFYLFFFFNDTATTEIYTYDTLFPYTTLFRSQPGGVVAGVVVPRLGDRLALLPVAQVLGVQRRRIVFQVVDHVHVPQPAVVHQAQPGLVGFDQHLQVVVAGQVVTAGLGGAPTGDANLTARAAGHPPGWGGAPV